MSGLLAGEQPFERPPVPMLVRGSRPGAARRAELGVERVELRREPIHVGRAARALGNCERAFERRPEPRAAVGNGRGVRSTLSLGGERG